MNEAEKQIRERKAFKGLKLAIERTNKIVTDLSSGSAIIGLEAFATVFGTLLNCYAAQNSNNPEGMCDDSKMFREHFCKIIMNCKSKREKETTRKAKRK